MNDRREDEEDILQEAINEAEVIRIESESLKEQNFNEESSTVLDNQPDAESHELLSENLNSIVLVFIFSLFLVSNISMSSNNHEMPISRNPSQLSLSQNNNNFQNSLTSNRNSSKILSSSRANTAPSYSTLIQMVIDSLIVFLMQAKKKAKKEKEKLDLPPPMTPQQIHAEISLLRSQISGVQKDKSVWKTKTLKAQQDLKNYAKDEALLLKAKAAPEPLTEFDDDGI